MKFYMAQIENYTQSKCILNNISMWERLNIVRKKKTKTTVFMTDMLLITENQIRFNETISLDVSIKIFVQQHHNVY